MSALEPWLEADAELEHAKPSVTAHVLRSIADTLDEAPDDVRYDLEVLLDEHQIGGDE